MSNEAEFDKAIEEQEADLNQRNRAVRRRNMMILFLAVVSVLFGVVCLYLAMDNARLAATNATYGQTQQQEKQGLAEEFDAACKSADFQQTPAGSNICRKAEQVASEPGLPLAGPQGVQGAQGPRGEQGFQGPLGPVGPKGDTGPQGLAGIIGAMGSNGSNGTPGMNGTSGPQGPTGPMGPQGPQGAAGADGAPGADSTVPGPEGPAGADGATGPQGEEGRGIQSASCGDNGRWLIIYTDGARQDGGECRATIIPPGVKP